MREGIAVQGLEPPAYGGVVVGVVRVGRAVGEQLPRGAKFANPSVEDVEVRKVRRQGGPPGVLRAEQERLACFPGALRGEHHGIPDPDRVALGDEVVEERVCVAPQVSPGREEGEEDVPASLAPVHDREAAMSPRFWISDTAPSDRFPIYTRLNARDVLPDPLTPLGASMCWAGDLIPGWALSYVEDDAFRPEEVDHESAVAALFYGYLYANLSALRVLGMRRGLTWELVDSLFFNAVDAPEHDASPDDEDPGLSRGIPERVAWALGALEYPEVEEDWALALRLRAERPQLSALSNRMLLARARAMMPYARVAFRSLMNTATNGGVVQGTLAAMLGEDGARFLVPLLAAPTGVESANPARDLWALSRLPADSPAFSAGFDDFLARHGYRGPAELDPGTASWETDPASALRIVDQLRGVDDRQSPEARASESARSWEETRDEARALLGDEVWAQVEVAHEAYRRFAAWRELGRGAVGIILNEARVALAELGRRLVAQGVLEDAADVALAVDSELDGLAMGSREIARRLGERRRSWAELAAVDVPLYLDTREPMPSLESLPRRRNSPAEAAPEGTVLSGEGTSFGVVEAPAFVALSPEDAALMPPGSVLVAQRTDTSWTPMFLAASAVVVETGSMASHAMIVSRELGIPCVAGVTQATERLGTGDVIRVDGVAGSVAVLQRA